MTTIASHLVDGIWEDGDSTVDVTNPADGSVVGRLAWGDAKTAQRAADAAARHPPRGEQADRRAGRLHR